MKILLTGITGQLGYELQHSLQGLGEIIGVDRTRMDLANIAQVRDIVRTVKPDLIINPAAYTAVDKAESEPDLAMRINGEAPTVMAEEAAKLDVPIIHYSTDYVFDGTKRGPQGQLVPYTENDRPNPVNVYGKSKLAGEQGILASGCPHLILRTSWVYSTRGRNFLLTMLRLSNERDEIAVVDDQHGSPTWAKWIAIATAQIIRDYTVGREQSGVEYEVTRTGVSLLSLGFAEYVKSRSGIYNLVNANVTTWKGFAQEIFEQAVSNGLLNKAPVVRAISSRDYSAAAARPANSTLSLDALSRRLGIRPPTWQASLAECMLGEIVSPEKPLRSSV